VNAGGTVTPRAHVPAHGSVAARRFSVAALCALPVVAAFVLILLFGENVLTVDEWRIVAHLGEIDAGRFELGDLLHVHVAHRIPFPLLVMLGLALVTDFNSVAAMLASLAIQAVSMLTLLAMYRRRFASEDRLGLGFVPIAFLFFSFAQFGTLLNGFSLSYTMGLGGSVVSLACLERAARAGCAGRWFVAAVLTATVATFSVTMGLFVWWAGLLLIAMAAQPGTKRRLTSLWASIGVLEWVLYFLGFEFAQSGEVTLLPIVTAPLEALRFGSTLLGHSLYQSRAISPWVGAALSSFLLLAIALVIRRGRALRLSFWIAVLFFFCASAHSVVQARLALGIAQAMVSHYCCITLPIVACTYVLLFDAWRSSRSRWTSIAFGAYLVLILASIPPSYFLGYESARQLSIGRRQEAFILRTYETQPNAYVAKLRPAIEGVRSLAPFLERKRLNAFSEGVSLLGDPGRKVRTELEFAAPVLINGTPYRPQNEEPYRISKRKGWFYIIGWAVDPLAQLPAGGVSVTIDGRRYPAFYGTERPTLGRTRGKLYRFSGFERAIDLGGIDTGLHELSIVVLTADRSAELAPLRRYELLVE